MKKFVLTLTAILGLALQSEAQSIKIAKDTVKGVATENGIDLHNDITNLTSSTITINWRILNTNITTASGKWYSAFGLCDNKTCYNNGVLAGSSKTTLDVAGNATMDFKISITDLAGVTNNGPFYVTVEASNGTTLDTATFVLSKWATNVNNINKSNDNVSLYPNPATNEVNVVFNGLSDVKTVGIYNLIGKLQSIYKVSGTSANINVETLPSGIYLLRLMDSQGHPVVIRKFNKL